MIQLRGSHVLRLFRGVPGKQRPMDTCEITEHLRFQGYDVDEPHVANLLARAREDQRALTEQIASYRPSRTAAESRS